MHDKFECNTVLILHNFDPCQFEFETPLNKNSVFELILAQSFQMKFKSKYISFELRDSYELN